MATIRSIALKAREIAEREAKSEGLFSDQLEGFCARGSAILYRELKKAGIKARIHLSYTEEYSHVFLRVGNHIVDITATQFNEEPVSIVPIWGKKPDYWRRDYEFETIKELVHLQKIEGWPREQMADLS